MNNHNKKFLTPEEVINILGISYPTLLRWVKGDSIPYLRIGKSLRFPAAYFEQIEKKALKSVDLAEEEI